MLNHWFQIKYFSLCKSFYIPFYCIRCYKSNFLLFYFFLQFHFKVFLIIITAGFTFIYSVHFGKIVTIFSLYIVLLYFPKFNNIFQCFFYYLILLFLYNSFELILNYRCKSHLNQLLKLNTLKTN